MRSLLLSAVFGLILAMGVSSAASAADAEQGGKLARRRCSMCHLLAYDQLVATDAVPTFADIARRKTDDELALYMVDSHPKMANMGLTRYDIADIIAFMRNLRR